MYLYRCDTSKGINSQEFYGLSNDNNSSSFFQYLTFIISAAFKGYQNVTFSNQLNPTHKIPTRIF